MSWRMLATLFLLWFFLTALDVRVMLLSATVGLVLGLTVAYGVIYNRLVEADRRRAHDKVDKDQDARRI